MCAQFGCSLAAAIVLPVLVSWWVVQSILRPLLQLRDVVQHGCLLRDDSLHKFT